jgi:site-specific DNA-adenine methylase
MGAGKQHQIRRCELEERMPYPGGKSGSGVYQTIINQIPPHKLYVEGFLGGGAILRLKKPAAASIGIDIDGDAISSFKALVPSLVLLKMDFLEWVASNVLPDDAFVYLDPPYLMETRSCQKNIYRFEFFTRDHHARLIDAIRKINCPVMISGYPSGFYDIRLPGWRSMHYQAQTHGGIRTECLWMNYPEPSELHDYRYLGTNFRERERIKRKQLRWKNRLEKMDRFERAALMLAISETRSQNTIKSDAGSELANIA